MYPKGVNLQQNLKHHLIIPDFLAQTKAIKKVIKTINKLKKVLFPVYGQLATVPDRTVNKSIIPLLDKSQAPTNIRIALLNKII